ncbi:hypothetical protein AMS68_002653 [Peltaster fructicola]|uniref:CWH43-like N-terminal domain-containing protein n=1 Tax=Peltaster fructicola TaxID=286661 RepID=A0A6H0XR22_9PEZI|nr:hypothetical protein AMS68_002653 [Peltaster fructicola]
MFGLSYWVLPLWSGCIWLATLLAMLLVWVRMGEPRYREFTRNQNVPYISDIGATSWGYPTFIAGSASAISVFTLTFVAERWLRHKGRLAKNYNVSEKILSGFATLFALIGALGLIFLTIFDTVRYPHVHVSMLCVFIAGYIISAIFICAEYQRLGVHWRQHRILAASFWIKLGFIIVEIAMAIAFGVEDKYGNYNTAGVLEWTISLIFIFYMLSFIIDFLPATRTRHMEDRFGLPHMRGDDDEKAMQTQASGNMMGGPVYSNGGHYGENGHQAPAQDARYNTTSRNF